MRSGKGTHRRRAGQRFIYTANFDQKGITTRNPAESGANREISTLQAFLFVVVFLFLWYNMHKRFNKYFVRS